MASHRNSCSLLGETEAYDDAIRMEVGEVAIAAINEEMKLIHDFGTPMTSADSPYLLS